MENVRLPVSDFVALVNQTLDYAFAGNAVVVGEVSGFSIRQGRWVRFKLKDDASSIDVFGSIYQMNVPLEDGMLVAVQGRPKLSNLYGFSFGFQSVQPVGEGSIKRSFDLLLKKLTAEGLFDESRKRPLPHLPAHIGLISSTQAAGYVDFLTILNQRWGGMTVDVANTLVQGMNAPRQIIAAINHFNAMATPPEVIVIVRGGGNPDDLAAFNDESLVRSIAASRVPTLVGVGHEIDTTLADMAADRRAATPTNAAQILVPDRRELAAHLSASVRHMLARMEGHVQRKSETIDGYQSQMLQRLDQRYDTISRAVDHLGLLLKQLDPAAALRRGYALVRTSKGDLIRAGTTDDVKAGDELVIETYKKIIRTRAETVYDKEN